MHKAKNKIIIIVGTNASGKSSLAVSLAKKFDGEVISADSRQVYKGLDIGTGKVTESEMDGIPHHLLDVVHPTKIYTAADFARDGQKALQDIILRGKLPIIAGGTGFYIDALLNPNLLAEIPPNKKLRNELEKLSVEVLFARLEKLDPVRAEGIEKKNRRRLVRAVEVTLSQKTLGKSTGKPMLNVDILWIGIKWDKEELEERIRIRTTQRIKDGMIEEAKELHKKGISYKRMHTLGLEYKHLADYLQKKISEEELTENIIIGDRQYAKRQRTWFKRNTNIHWFENSKFNEVDTLISDFLHK